WYLLSFDLDREDWRTFRLDRIRGVHRTGWRFTARADVPDPAAHVQHSVTSGQFRHAAVILVRAPAAEVSECFPPTYGTVTALHPVGHPDGALSRLATGADDRDVLAWYLARLPAPFEVASPPELRGRIAELSGHLARAAGTSGPRDQAPPDEPQPEHAEREQPEYRTGPRPGGRVGPPRRARRRPVSRVPQRPTGTGARGRGAGGPDPAPRAHR